MSNRRDPDALRPSPHLTDDQALDLTHGLASPEQETSLLDHVRGCEECEHLLRRAAGERERMRAGPRARVVAERVVLAERQVPAPKGEKDRLRSWRLGGIAVAAAAVVALLFIGKAPEQDSGMDPGQAHWISVDQPLRSLRSTQGDEVAGLRTMLELYEARDTKQALAFLDTASFSPDFDTAFTLRLLLLADLVLRDTGDTERGLALLAEVDLPTLPQPWRDEGRWIKYRALVLANRREEASKILLLLVSAPGKIGELARQLAASVADNSGSS